jgi:hypothetical protein
MERSVRETGALSPSPVLHDTESYSLLRISVGDRSLASKDMYTLSFFSGTVRTL